MSAQRHAHTRKHAQREIERVSVFDTQLTCRGAAGPSFSPSRTGVLNVAKVRPGRLAAAATRTSRANMAVKENEELPEHIEWNVDTEVQLFYAMTGHKPVGKYAKTLFLPP